MNNRRDAFLLGATLLLILLLFAFLLLFQTPLDAPMIFIPFL